MNIWPSRDLLDCLGWTLLHFLWQGLLIAALFAASLFLLRRRSPNLRYLAGCLALLLMTAAPVLTFYSLPRRDVTPAPKFIIQTSSVADTIYDSPTTISIPQPVPAVMTRPPIHKRDYSRLLESSLPWLVAAWSLGVIALSCRLLAGWLFLQRLCRNATTALLDPWQSKIKLLAMRIGVSRPLRLLQSACVEVPTVIGWLRPVILLPASCLTGLTLDQLESILAHELAHIRRHDYLVNLFQNLVETLLFYHPAIWWVSRRIRRERELCCDDLAVKICGDALVYARALATLEELRPAPAQLALAAAGAPLLERIRRLAGQPERSPVRPGWPVAGIVALLLLAIIASSFRNNPASAQTAAQPPAPNQSTDFPSSTNPVAPLNQSSFTSQPTRSSPNAISTPQTGASLVSPSAPATNISLPSNQIRFESRLNKLSPPDASTSSNNPPLPQIDIQSKWVELDAAKYGSNALASLPGPRESPKLIYLPATFSFSDYLLLDSVNGAEMNQTNFIHAYTNAAFLTTLTESQTRSVTNQFSRQSGVDILAAPEVIVESGRRARIQIGEMDSLIIGGPVPGRTNGPRVLTNIPTGIVMDLSPTLAADGHSVKLKVHTESTEFAGYENPATVTNKEGKPMPKDWAIPRLRLRQLSTDVTVANNQTLVLGCGPVPITGNQLITNTVPVLGHIPLLGRLFRSTKTVPNSSQKILLLFITTKLVNPDGTPDRSPEQPHQEKSTKQSAAFDRTNLVYTSKGRQKIFSKLDRIHVENVAYDSLPLGEVINHLSTLAKKNDPEGTGINFFLSRDPVNAIPGQIDPATGLPIPAFDTNVDIKNVTVTIDPPLKDIRLADLLDAIAKTADTPIKYTVLDYAVVFSLRAPEPVPLQVRTYHLDPSKFSEMLNDTFDGEKPATNKTNAVTKPAQGIIFGGTDREERNQRLESIQASVRRFFASVGVDFDTNKPANIGKAVIWNDRKGVLTVRATAADLDLLAAVIETFSQTPRSVPWAAPVPNPPSTTNVPKELYPNPGRQALISKLNTIRLPALEYNRLPLPEVLNDLNRRINLDPQADNINMYLSRRSTNLFPTVATDPLNPVIDFASITIHPALKNVRLIDALDAIARDSDLPIRFDILDYAVVFSLRDTNETPPLEIRTFHVDPAAFGRQLGITLTTNAPFIVDPTHQFGTAVRRFFASAGVDFSTNGTGNTFSYTSRESVLVVRATHEDLEKIGSAIKTLNQKSVPPLGNRVFPVNTSGGYLVWQDNITDGSGLGISAVKIEPTPPPLINLKVKFVEVDDSSQALGFTWGSPVLPLASSNASVNLSNIVLPPSSKSNQPVIRTTASLTEVQYKAVLTALNQKTNARILDAPEVTVESGRQAHIQPPGERDTSAKSGHEPSPFVPAIDALPSVSPDEFSIELSLVPPWQSVASHKNAGNVATDMEGKPLRRALVPIFSLNNPAVFDGQTLVLSGPVPGDPDHRRLTIFITPTIINPDGTPVHSEAQKQAFLQSLPSPSAFPGQPEK